MKKISLLLCLLLLVPLFSCGSKQTTTEGDTSYVKYLRYKIEDKGVTITGLESDAPETIVIPGSIDGKSVKKIGDGAFSDTNVKNVSIPSTVKKYGAGIFDRCATLEKLTISSAVILDYIFENYHSPNFKEIIFTDDSNTLYNESYDTLSYIEKLTIPHSIDTIEEDALIGFTGVTELTMSGHISFSKNFKGDISPKIVNILDGSLFVVNNSFNDCNIEAVNIPSSVKIIERGAFSECRKLTTVSFEDNSQLTSVQSKSFQNTGISKLDIPSTVNHIGSYVFFGSAIKSFTFPAGVDTVSEALFQYSDLESIVLPETINKIERGSFSNCTSLKSIEFMSPFESSNTFLENNTSLEEIICHFASSDIDPTAFFGYNEIVQWD